MDGGDQAGFGVVGGHVGDVLDLWPNEVIQWVQVGGGGEPVREGYKVVALLLKPSLGLFGLIDRRRVLLPHSGSATGLLIAPGDHFEDVRWYDVALTWNHTKDHKCSRKLSFHHPPALSRLDLHFEGAGYGPVVITWIGREHALYRGASPISLVEHCVTFRHDRRLLSLLGFVHNWSTSRWSATKKKKKKEKKTGLRETEMESCCLFSGDNFIVPPCKIGDLSRGWPIGSLFNSYYTEI